MTRPWSVELKVPDGLEVLDELKVIAELKVLAEHTSEFRSLRMDFNERYT
jgi:hypothetical protein